MEDEVGKIYIIICVQNQLLYYRNNSKLCLTKIYMIYKIMEIKKVTNYFMVILFII